MVILLTTHLSLYLLLIIIIHMYRTYVLVLLAQLDVGTYILVVVSYNSVIVSIGTMLARGGGSVTQLRCMAIFGCDVSNAPLPDVPVMVSRYWLARRRHDTPPHVCRRRVITS